MDDQLEQHYLIDTVTLVKMSSAQFRSDFFLSKSTILEEIRHEFRDNSKADDLVNASSEPDVELLMKISEVLKQPIVQSLLKLYDCQGNGDVMLLAKAMLEKERGAAELFPLNWVIVTDDKGLTKAAQANGIDVISTAEFLPLIAQAQKVS